MAKEAVIKAKLTLNGAQFHAGLKSARSAVAGFAGGVGGKLKGMISSPLAAIGAGLAGAFTVGAFVSGIKGALNMGAELDNLKNRTGESVDKLMVFQQVLKANGVDAESAGQALNKMGKIITAAAEDTTGAVTPFDRIGVSVKGLLALSPVDQFRAIGAALAKVPDPATRSARAMEIFGKTGGAMLGALGNAAGFDVAAKSIGSQAQILARNSGLFHEISDRLERAGLKLQGFFVGAADKLAPALDAMTKLFDGKDFATQGAAFGKGIIDATNILVGVFQNPRLLTSGLELALEGTMKSAGNYLAAAIRGGFDVLFNEMFWNGLEDGLKGVGNVLGGALVTAFQKGTAELYAGIEEVMELLPESLGGRKSNNESHRAAGDELSRLAVSADERSMDYREKFQTSGDAQDWIKADKHHANALRMIAKAGAEYAQISDHPETHEERVARIMKGGEIGRDAKEMTDKGRALIAQGIEQVGVAFKDGLLAMNVDDIFGAGEAWKKFGAAMNKAKEAGEKTTSALMDGMKEDEKAGALHYHDSVQQFRGFGGFRDGVGVGSGYVQGSYGGLGGSNSAYNSTPLYSASERAAFEDQSVLAGNQRHSSSYHGYHAVKLGDAARVKQHKKDLLEGKVGVEKTNILLEKILKPIQKTSDNLDQWNRP